MSSVVQLETRGSAGASSYRVPRPPGCTKNGFACLLSSSTRERRDGRTRCCKNSAYSGKLTAFSQILRFNFGSDRVFVCCLDRCFPDLSLEDAPWGGLSIWSLRASKSRSKKAPGHIAAVRWFLFRSRKSGGHLPRHAPANPQSPTKVDLQSRGDELTTSSSQPAADWPRPPRW